MKKTAAYYNNEGITYEQSGDILKAKKYFKKAIKANPKLAQPYYNLGTIQLKTGDSYGAIKNFKRAIKIEPNYSKAHSNLGVSYKNIGKAELAMEHLEKTYELQPDADALYNLGAVSKDLNKVEDAIDFFTKAISLNPHHQDAYANLIEIKRAACDWEGLEGLVKSFDLITDNSLKAGVYVGITPFMDVYLHENSEHNLQVARSWSNRFKETANSLSGGASYAFDKKRTSKRIKVGYLSNDYYDHATAHLMLSFFRRHDRNKFEIFAYSYGKDDKSIYRKGIKRDCDQFVDIKKYSFKKAADRIYKDKIDILVDLKGHTKGSRLEICALKPAPIQMTYLGFPGTTGGNYMDYIISDNIVTPKRHAKYYTEKYVLLPGSYQINDDEKKISKENFTRSDFNIPEGSFIFSCFNSTYKIDPLTMASWINILKRVPKSFLWLYSSNPVAVKNMRRMIKKKGIDPKRVKFSGPVSNAQHLRRISLSDLALDTFIYNGHTTTSDALWTGVPVVAKMGNHFASRVSASILTAVGLKELITKTDKEYVNLAVSLAKDKKKLDNIRKKLSKNRLTYPLFDTKGFVNNLEKAYLEVWKYYLKGNKPRPISIQ